MYFRPPGESWSPPPSGACLNPWTPPAGGADSNVRTSAYWSDTPFPKEGATFQSLLDELVEQLFQDLYDIIAAEDAEPGDPGPAAAEPPAAEEPPSLRSKITGVYEAPQLPPHAAYAAPLGAVWPSEARNRTCGKLALLYPLRSSWIASAVDRKRDAADWRSVKACTILANWLREMYSDEANEEAGSARSCFCNFCQRSFRPFNFRVRCAECADYDLCERCFAEGRQSEGHSQTHRYIPVGPQTRPLFRDQWSASEELVLLEAVGKYGFGNWNEVSEWVSTVSPGNTVAKDKDVCKKEYFDLYLLNKKLHASPTWPIQNLKSKLLYDGALGFTQALSQHCGPAAPPEAAVPAVDYAPIFDARGIDLLTPAAAEPPWPEEYGDPDEWEQPAPPAPLLYQACKPAGALPPRVSVVGYLSNRGESDNEWENQYELAICDLEIKPWETPMEKEAKLRALEAYNTVLDQRVMRKRLYLEKYILNSPSGSGGSVAASHSSGLDFKSRWLGKNNASTMHAALRQLWQYTYSNRAEAPAALFTKTQKHPDCLSDVLANDLEELPDLIADDAQLVDRLDLLTAWHEADLRSVADVAERGGPSSQAIDTREPVFWSLKYYVDAPTSEAPPPLVEVKSEGSSTRGRLNNSTEPRVYVPPKALHDMGEKLRLSLGLSPPAYAQLSDLIKSQLAQCESDTPSLVDVVIDAQTDDGPAAPEPPPPPPPAATRVSEAAAPPPSANPVLSFAQRQVLSEASTPRARTIPKKRRTLTVEEEGEIHGG